MCWRLFNNRIIKVSSSNFLLVGDSLMGKARTKASQVALVVKNLPAKARDTEIWVWSLDGEDPPKEEMATHSSILARIIPGTEEQRSLAWGHKESDTTELSIWAQVFSRVGPTTRTPGLLNQLLHRLLRELHKDLSPCEGKGIFLLLIWIKLQENIRPIFLFWILSDENFTLMIKSKSNIFFILTKYVLGSRIIKLYKYP